ncbi:MAG: MOSC domain-containing protein [bacterium]|nr:MOSC domain-containing protein [bacterium]
MQISEINIYPIKSLKGIALNEAVVEKRGLRFDRRWMLTDRDGMFFTQREVPKMAAIAVRVDSGQLIVESESAGTLTIPFEPDRGSHQNVTVWQSDVAGVVYNGEVSEWFSDVLGRSCQLVLMPEKSHRHVSEKFDRGDDIVSFADGYPLLLIGEGSLANVNERLHDIYRDEEYGEKLPLPMNRFRPNLVVEGSDPFEEDNWSRIRVGEAIFWVVKPCARCVMTTVDQDRGDFDGKEPLKTIASFRMAKDVFPDTFGSFGQTANAVLFGENLIPENPGAMVRVGDEVQVLETRRAI